MKRVMVDLTIPVVVGLLWGALVVSSMNEVKDLAAVLMRPSFEESIEVKPASKATALQHHSRARLAAKLVTPETVG